MFGDLDESADAMLRKVQDCVNEELDRQYGQLGHSLRDFFYDLFNYELERPWRESLAIFAEHWVDRGLRLTPRTLNAIAQLIAEELGDPEDAFDADNMAVALAEPPDSGPSPSGVGTDAVLSMAPVASPAPKADETVEAAARRERERRIVAETFAARAQQRLQLTDDERTHLEFYMLENLRRDERGWPLLPPPRYYFDKDYEYRQKIANQPSIRGLTKEEAERSALRWKYEHLDQLPPEEQERLRFQALMEQRRQYTEKYGLLAAFLNPAFDGTGTLNDWAMVVGGFGSSPPPGLDLRGPQGAPLTSPHRRRRRGSSNPAGSPAKGSTPDRAKRPERKPPFPPPVSTQRVTIRKGKRTPHPSHKRGAAAEQEAADFIHTLPGEVVLFWGQKIGGHGADVVSYNLKTKTVTLWDVKWRGKPVRIRPSKTFQKDSSALTKALKQAADSVQASKLSKQHKDAAIRSMAKKTFQTRTLGAGHAKSSTFGDHK